MARKPLDSNQGLGIELIQLAEIRDQTKELNRRLDKQARMLSALWQFVKAELELEDDDLRKMVEKLTELAEKEGSEGGGLTNCPKCGEPVKGKRTTCFWCGHQFPSDLFDI